jgi:hypothetical protein
MMSLGQHPMTGRLPLGEGWDRHAREWIAWARTGLDSYESFHRDAFLPLVQADPDRPFVIDGSYLKPERYVDAVDRDGLTMTFHGEHRPLQAYTEALADEGFVIERLREPTSPDPAKPWSRIPLFLDIVAALQATRE